MLKTLAVTWLVVIEATGQVIITNTGLVAIQDTGQVVVKVARGYKNFIKKTKPLFFHYKFYLLHY